MVDIIKISDNIYI